MTLPRPLRIIRGIGLSVPILLIVAGNSVAQVSGANIFNRIVGGVPLADMRETNIAELVDMIASDVWIVGGDKIPGLKGQLQIGVRASSEKDGSTADWIFEKSEPFKLASKLDPDSDDKMLRSYAGYYAINVGEVVPAKQLLKMVDEVSYGEERPVRIWGDKPMPIPIEVPCCKPVDAEMLMKALTTAGLVGEEGVLDQKGGLREGFLLIAFVPLSVDSKESMAPGFGERRKGSGGGLWVLKSAK